MAVTVLQQKQQQKQKLRNREKSLMRIQELLSCSTNFLLSTKSKIIIIFAPTKCPNYIQDHHQVHTG
jgi:arginine utilization protein RocB